MIVLTTRRPEINSRVQTEGSYATITLSHFKEFLKWNADDTSEDTTMTYCLVSTIKQAEMYTRRVIERATWRSYLDGFYNATFDVAPIDLTTAVVKYFNDANVETTLATTEYTLKDFGADGFAEIEFESTSTFPELYDRFQPVFIEYEAGYETYPSDLIAIILQEAATRFENRTNEVAGSLGQVSFGFHQRLFPYKML